MSLVTTTSPNYLLMGALDAAQAQLAERGKAMAEASVRAAETLRRRLHQVPGLPVLEQELVGKGGVTALDPGKITLQVSALGVTGPEAAEAFRQAGIAVELVDEDHVLLLVTYADEGPELEKVGETLCRVLEEIRKPEQKLGPVPPAADLPEMVVTPREAFFASHGPVAFEEAAGKIAGETISFYPPGIPLVMPGERITEELIRYCREMQKKKLLVSGPRDSSLQQIEVLR